jgi:hypothetical protein
MYGLAINGDVTLFGIDFGASAMGYMSLTSLREKYKVVFECFSLSSNLALDA